MSSVSLPIWLLGLAIASSWFPLTLPTPLWGLPVWLLAFVLALGSGLVTGVLVPISLVWIGLLGAACLASARIQVRGLREAAWLAAVLIALALALHALPGFHNPRIIDHATISLNAPALTLYGNFDKATAGLLLMQWGRLRRTHPAEAQRWIGTTVLAASVTAAVTLGCGWLLGLIQPDLKWPAVAPSFLGLNLLFTCLPEEAFFRGTLQARLQDGLPPTRLGTGLAVLVSATLFGLAHAGHGWLYPLLAGLSGLGNAWVYARTRRVEAAMACHFATNALHFLCFTYPLPSA
jgi:membrane protease YdiL (CAAX protease family)